MAVMQISGAFITERIREFWEDGSYSEALSKLDGIFGEGAMTLEQKIDLIEGRKKFEGMTEMDLIEDDWELPEGYPTFYQVMDRATVEQTFYERAISDDNAIADFVIETMSKNDEFHWSDPYLQRQAERWHNILPEAKQGKMIPLQLWQYLTFLGYATPADRERLQLRGGNKIPAVAYYDTFPEEAWSNKQTFHRWCFWEGINGKDRDELWSNRTRRHKPLMSPRKPVKKVEAPPKKYNEKRETWEYIGWEDTKKPDPLMKIDSGWIDELGNYYSVDECKHWTFVDLFFDVKKYDGEKLAQDKGWIKIHYTDQGDFFITQGNQDVNQAQLNTLHKYCEKHNHDLPDWALDSKQQEEQGTYKTKESRNDSDDYWKE